SYGVNGNRTGRYASQAIVSSSYQYVFGDGSSPYSGQYISKLPNDDLGWEKTIGFNIGLDYKVGGFSGSVDYYNSNTTDLFWNIQLPQITGFTNIASNIGKLNNTGLEVTLTSMNINTLNFSWETTLNYCMNRNKLLNTGDNDEDGMIGTILFHKTFLSTSASMQYMIIPFKEFTNWTTKFQRAITPEPTI